MKTLLLSEAFRVFTQNVYVLHGVFLTVSQVAVLQDVNFCEDLCVPHIFRHLMMHTDKHIFTDTYCLYLCQVLSVIAVPVIVNLVSFGEVEEYFCVKTIAVFFH